MPTFESTRDLSGMIKPIYQQQSQLNTQGLEALRGEALRDPSQMSRWRELAQGQAMNELRGQQAGQLAQAQQGLAAAGGLSGGARERLQRQSMLGGLQGQQNIWSQMAAADEQKRQAALAMLPSQELATAGYMSDIQGRNIERALQDITQQRGFDLTKYQEQMKLLAAKETAKAVPKQQGFMSWLFG